MHTSAEFAEEFTRLSRQLDGCLSMLKDQVRAYATAENAYRAAKARAWLEAPRYLDGDGPKITAGEREAWVNGATAPEREKRDLADGMRQAALEAVRSRRGQISALQTLLNAHQEEAKFARAGRGEAA